MRFHGKLDKANVPSSASADVGTLEYTEILIIIKKILFRMNKTVQFQNK
jgi:hypothetical protein